MIKFMLMNYTFPVAEIEIDETLTKENDFIHISNIIDINRLPFSVQYAAEMDRDYEIEHWILHRIIPKNRDEIKLLLNKIGDDRLLNSLEAHGQSLSDGYWFKRVGEHINWEDISFRKNKFPNDIGNFFFGLNKRDMDINSPDLTSNGWLKKAWRIRDDETYLLKQGSGPCFEEPYNEVIATNILKKYSKLPFVEYKLQVINGHPCSICKNFIDEGVQFITADDIYRTRRKSAMETMDMHLRERCKFFKIPGYKEFLDNMRILDFIICNTDRHLGNFGFLLDVNTLKFIGPAPLFDNGTSIFNCDEQIPDESVEYLCESFKKRNESIKHPSKIDLSKLDKVDEIIKSVYSYSNIDSNRIDDMAKAIEKRTDVAKHEIEKYIRKEKARQKQKELERELR